MEWDKWVLNELVPLHRQWFNTLIRRSRTVGGVVTLCLSGHAWVHLWSYRPISVGAQSTLGEQDIFARKYMHEKLTKCPKFTWYLPEKLTKFPNFTWHMPEKINIMPEFYVIFARKIFFPIFFGGGGASVPRAPRLLRLYSDPLYHSRHNGTERQYEWDRGIRYNKTAGIALEMVSETVMCICDFSFSFRAVLRVFTCMRAGYRQRHSAAANHTPRTAESDAADQ